MYSEVTPYNSGRLFVNVRNLLLQSLVKKKQVEHVDNEISIRRFSSFGLLTMRGVDVDKIDNKCHRWYEYSSEYIPDCRVDIRYGF